jgi:hypothetical protein
MTTLEFPAFGDGRGQLAFLESNRHVPFEIGSICWWSDDEARALGTREPSEVDRVMYAIRGRVEVRVHDGGARSTVSLDRPDRGWLLPARSSWELVSASRDSVLVTASASRPGAAYSAIAAPVATPTVSDARVVSLASRAHVVEVHGGSDLPFLLARVYYLYAVPPGMSRGAHAHKKLEQLIVAVGGSFDIRLDDGTTSRTVRLDRPDAGLLVPRMLWRDLKNFSPRAVCLVLASLPFDEADYLREYDAYAAFRAQAGTMIGTATP